MNLRCAALNTGSDIHLLDHIAPLAHLLDMPLITTDELNYSLAQKYYPQIKTRHEPDLEHKLGDLAASYDALFECKYWAPHLKLLFRQLFNKEMRLVFCPHGQSDKGYQSPLLAPYVQQDRVLLYGNLLSQMLQELKLQPPPSATIGNYRLNFYKKHRSFYDELAENEVFSKLPRGNLNLLYAPTWKDADSGKIIGASMRTNLRMPDTRFEINDSNRAKIINLIRIHQPNVVITNAPTDRHPDHGRAASLVVESCFLAGLAKWQYDGIVETAWRPSAIYQYMQFYQQVPSFTYDITDTIEEKMECIKAHRSQFWDPNSIEPETLIASKHFLENIKSRASEYGLQAGFGFGEPFICLRTLGVKDIFSLH